MHLHPPKSTPSNKRSRREKSELALLALIRERAARGSHRGKKARALHLGIGDDCALLQLRPGEELAVTTDLSIAGRHFALDLHPPEAIGHRALARGLSDLAAMGARPVAAFLSLGLPRSLTGNWLNRFLDGFLALAETHRSPLAGGDLAESPIPVADIVLTGAVRRGRALLRSNARPGHLVYVTGCLGGAAAGLAQLRQLAAQPRTTARSQSETASHLRIPKRLAAALAPHLYPQPRIAQGLWLARRAISATGAFAAIDLSDGLSTDLAHLCQASGVATEIDATALPIAPAATLAQALHGGEDYEILFTATRSTRIPRRIAGVRVTRIGHILRAKSGTPQVSLVTASGAQPLAPGGWQHFS